MTDRPYTDDDLRAEAARQLANLSDHLNADRVGQEMCGAEIESQTPKPDEDGDDAPVAKGWEWDEVLDDEQFGKAERAVHGLINGAADVSKWAINLGADGLEPSTEHAISVDAGRPIARIHFAFEPDMPDEMRTGLVEGIGDSINDALGDDANEETDEHGDSDSDVFDLISDIASRLRDATDSGEYHAVGLIYDLANGRTTVAEARAELAEITFRHV